MRKLVEEYQNTITALQMRQRELQRALPTLRGEAYFLARRRLEALGQEQADLCYALQLMVSGRMWRGWGRGGVASRGDIR